MFASLALALIVLFAWSVLGVLGLYLVLVNLKDEEVEDDVPDRGEHSG